MIAIDRLRAKKIQSIIETSRKLKIEMEPLPLTTPFEYL